MTDEATPDEGQEPEPEMFPAGSLDGETIQPHQIIKKGTPTEVTVSIGKAEVPLKSGMIDPNKMGRCLVSYSFLKNEDVPHYEGEGAARKITRWKIRTHLTATYVAPANDEATLIRSEFAALMQLDPAAAVALAGELKEMATGLRAVA